METLLLVICLILSIILLILLVVNFEYRRRIKKLKEILRHKEVFINSKLKFLELSGTCIVDGDARPKKIDGYSVVAHNLNGCWSFDPENLIFLDINESLDGVRIYELVKKSAVNSNLIDLLLKKSSLIPKDWPEIFFCFGTIYSRNQDGVLFVRSLVRLDNGSYLERLRSLNEAINPKEVIIFRAGFV